MFTELLIITFLIILLITFALTITYTIESQIDTFKKGNLSEKLFIIFLDGVIILIVLTTLESLGII